MNNKTIKTVKNWLTRIIRGYSDVDKMNVNNFAVEMLYPCIDAFVEHSVQHGMYLPLKYKRDPAAWSEVLRKIQRAFYLSYTKFDKDSAYESTFEREKLDTLDKAVQEGFELFGEHLQDLFDYEHHENN